MKIKLDLSDESNMSKKPKIACVSGITGQDGSYLAELLLEKGYKVIGIKRRVSHLGSMERLDHVYLHKNFELVYGNMHDASSIFQIINKYKPDEFYNLAAQSHVRVSFEVTEETFETVTLSTLRILNAIKDFSPHTRFYQASSSEMFGVAPMPETGYSETSLMMPASPYAVAKLAAHHLVRNYRESYGIHASSGILFNHESPRRGETFVTRKITMAAARIRTGDHTQKLELGNLDAMRDWGYAPEYVYGMWLMLQQDKPDDYVLATGQTDTVRNFLKRVFGHANLSIEKHVVINERLFRPEEVPVLLGNPTKAKEKLGWTSTTDLNKLAALMYSEDLERLLP